MVNARRPHAADACSVLCLVTTGLCGDESGSQKFIRLRGLPVRAGSVPAARAEPAVVSVRRAANGRSLDQDKRDACALPELLLRAGGAQRVDDVYPLDGVDAR